MCLFFIQVVVVGILYTLFTNVSMFFPRLGGLLSVLPFISGASLLSTLLSKSVGDAKEQALCALASSVFIIGFYFLILVAIHLYNLKKAVKTEETVSQQKERTFRYYIHQFLIGCLIYALITGIAMISPRIGGYISVLPYISGSTLVNTMMKQDMLQTEIQAEGSVWGSVFTTSFYLITYIFFYFFS